MPAAVGRGLVAVGVALALTGCAGGGPGPDPGVTSTTEPATTTTRAPNITASAIPGLVPATIHDKLKAIGFATSEPITSSASFVSITSKRSDATVTSYGRTPAEVAKVVAEANRAVAGAVLSAVAAAPLKPAEAAKAKAWVKAELKKGPTKGTQPRSSQASYGKQPYELLVGPATATLSIGRITAS